MKKPEIRIVKLTNGYTVVEIVIVMGIIAVLTTLVIGGIFIARQTSRESANRNNAKAFQIALENYFSEYKEYPAIGGTSFIDGTNDIVTLNTTTTFRNSPLAAINLQGGCANGGAWVVKSGPDHGGYEIAVLDSTCQSELNAGIGSAWRGTAERLTNGQ